MLKKFNPWVSIDAIKRHVTEVENTRVTLRTSAEIYEALIHEPLNRGQTQYAPVYDKQSALYEEYRKLFMPFTSEVANFANFVSELANSVYPTDLADDVTYALRTGVIGCKCIESQFHQNMQSTLKHCHSFASSSYTATYIYQFLAYAYEIAPLYAWVRYNKHNDVNDVTVNDCTFPRDGRLYKYCFAVLPSTERAFALADFIERFLRCKHVELSSDEGATFDVLTI